MGSRKKCAALIGLPLVAFTMLALATPSSDDTLDRSPRDVALTPDGHWAITANHTSHSSSLVDVVAGEVVAETQCGRKPFCVALSSDGTRAVITNWESNSITVLSVHPPSMESIAEIPVGAEPRGIALTHDGDRVFVALGTEDEVAVVDLNRQEVIKRIPVAREPWHMAMSPDQRRVVVGCTGAATSTVIDTETLNAIGTAGVFGMNVRQVAISPDSQWAYVVHTSERGFPIDMESMSRGWAIANRLSRVSLTSSLPRQSVSLDSPGRAAGDADGVATSPDGKWLALTIAGTHQLFLFKEPLPWAAYGLTGDFMDGRLSFATRRIQLGGRPLAVRFSPDSRSVIVANYLQNSLSVVDVDSATVTTTISLGGPKEQSLNRKGEAIFTDAQRTFQQWFSCNTCHAEGHTNHANLDTLNDGIYGNPKKTPSLRGVVNTPPWTWHGLQTRLEDAVANSVTNTLHGKALSGEEMTAMMAFLSSLDYPPNPNRGRDGTLSDSARRGERLFHDRRCIRCHAGTYLTTAQTVDVGTGASDDRYVGFNPPSLRNVYDRAPYLHDGRAKTLADLLSTYHQIDRINGGKPLTNGEIEDLVAFLKSM